MATLSGLFGATSRPDSFDFKYDPSKQKKAQAAAQANPFPFQSQVHVFRLDQSTNENKSVGNVMFLICPVAPAYQLMIYQNQASPLVSLTISPSIGFSLRGQVYGYLTTTRGRPVRAR
jgi:hypothetical protein